jgi:hypothetical protein
VAAATPSGKLRTTENEWMNIKMIAHDAFVPSSVNLHKTGVEIWTHKFVFSSALTVTGK